MKKLIPVLFFLALTLIFSWKFLVYGLLPIPADTLVGLYHPYRDFYSQNYPNGMPFKNFLITDPIRQQYPWRWLAINDLKNGVLPLWNPYSFAGTPLAANYQAAAYYPLNILFFLMPFATAWSILVVMQPFLAGGFMYLYLKKMRISVLGSLVGAIVYAFSGFNIAWFTWNTLGHVALWLPLILYFKENVLSVLQHKKIRYKPLILYGLGLILAESMYIFAGHAQIAFYVFCISNLYLLVRTFHIYKTLGNKKKILLLTSIYFTVLAFIIGLLTLIQTLPFIRFVLQSGRSIDQNSTQEGWFIPFKHLIQFFAPDFFGNPATLNYWGTWNYGEMVGYVGVIPLILVFVSLSFMKRKMILFFSVVAFLALLFSTNNIFANLPFILHIPLLSTSQPTRLLFIIDFCLAVLSALGLDLMTSHKVTSRRLLIVGCSTILLFGLLWVLAYFQIFTQNIDSIAVSKRNLILPTLFMIVGILYLLLYKKIPKKYAQLTTTFLVLVVIIDLFRFGWKFTPFVSAEYLYPNTKAVEFISSQPGLFRIMSLDNRIFPPNVTMPHKIQTLDGYDPLYLKNYYELASSLVRNKPDISPFSFNRIITIQQPDNKIIDFMNVKYILSMSDIVSPKLEKVFEEGQTKIYENKLVFPRAFFVTSTRKASSKQEAINFLYDSTIDLHTAAIVYENIPISSEKLSPTEQITISAYQNSMIGISSTTDQARLLVLSDVYYPNWKAYIDQVETKIYEVNYAFRGIVIPAGTHTILFKYL